MIHQATYEVCKWNAAAHLVMMELGLYEVSRFELEDARIHMS